MTATNYRRDAYDRITARLQRRADEAALRRTEERARRRTLIPASHADACPRCTGTQTQHDSCCPWSTGHEARCRGCGQALGYAGPIESEDPDSCLQCATVWPDDPEPSDGMPF